MCFSSIGRMFAECNPELPFRVTVQLFRPSSPTQPATNRWMGGLDQMRSYPKPAIGLALYAWSDGRPYSDESGLAADPRDGKMRF